MPQRTEGSYSRQHRRSGLRSERSLRWRGVRPTSCLESLTALAATLLSKVTNRCLSEILLSGPAFDVLLYFRQQGRYVSGRGRQHDVTSYGLWTRIARISKRPTQLTLWRSSRTSECSPLAASARSPIAWYIGEAGPEVAVQIGASVIPR